MFRAKHLRDMAENGASAIPVELRETYSEAVEQIQSALDDLSDKVSEQSRKIKTFTR